MALVLNEEQQMLRDSAKSFIQETSPVSAHRAMRDSGEEWSPEFWNSVVEMGWPGIVISGEYGGLGFGYVGAGVVQEECGRTLASSPLVSSAFVCSSLISSLGSDDQKASLLPAISGGESIFALASGESQRFDPLAVSMTAISDEDGYVLAGTKTHVVDGNVCSHYIVVARTNGVVGDADGLSLFVVDKDANGVSRQGTLNADSRISTAVNFDNVKVDRSSLLGKLSEGGEALQRAMDIGAVLSAAELLGLADEAFKRTIEYLSERRQFGVVVASFQSLQHRAAQLFCELELCRSAVLKALKALDEDAESRSQLASAAKAKMAKTAKLAVNEAVQMHAGIGMTDEIDIGFFMKRAAAACQEYGDYYYHADRFAKLGGY